MALDGFTVRYSYRFTGPMMDAIGRSRKLGRRATEAECKAWFEVEDDRLMVDLLAMFGTDEERERCRAMRRKRDWLRVAKGPAPRDMRVVWDGVGPPLAVVGDGEGER